MATMKERMLRGDLYLAGDAQLVAERARAQSLLERYNATSDAEFDERTRLLRALLGDAGEGSRSSPPFAATTAATSRSAPARS